MGIHTALRDEVRKLLEGFVPHARLLQQEQRLHAKHARCPR